MMTGTQCARNLSAWARPPGAPSAQVASRPSLPRFAARKENAGQRPERQDVRGAEGWVRGDRAEERERAVAGGVLIAPLGALGTVDGPGSGVAAGWSAGGADRVVPAWVIAHVLQVRRPAAPGGRQLV